MTTDQTRPKPFAERAAAAAVTTLIEYTGFDDWWDGLLTTTRSLIRSNLAAAICAEAEAPADFRPLPEPDDQGDDVVARVSAWLERLDGRFDLVSRSMLGIVESAARVEEAHRTASLELDAERAAKAPDPARVYALQAAAQWLSTPNGGRAASDVVSAAEAFEAYLREDR